MNGLKLVMKYFHLQEGGATPTFLLKSTTKNSRHYTYDPHMSKEIWKVEEKRQTIRGHQDSINGRMMSSLGIIFASYIQN